MIESGATETVILIGAVAGALVAIATAVRKAWRAIRKAWARLKAIAAQLEAAADLAQAQLKPNGGSSLLDKVNSIASNHAEARAHWTALEEGQQQVVRRLEKVEWAVSQPKGVEE